MTETASATTFSVLPKLPWAGEPPALDLSGKFEKAGIYGSGFRSEFPVQSISGLGAILKGELASQAGEQITLELATGHRPAAAVSWVTSSSFGVQFKQPIDILALINRTLVCQSVERRKMPRVELRCTGWLKDRDEFSVATVRNISAGGLHLESDGLPGIGAELTLYVEGLNIPPCELVWKRDTLGGVQFRHELSWALIVPWLRNLLRNAAS